MFTEDRKLIENSFKFLLASRTLRSIALILVNLSLSLYLKALGYGLIFIGIVYFFIVLFNVLIAFIFGTLGDRIGYARTLLIAEFLPMIALLGLTL
ncbi:MAG: hypothetical protein ACP5GS_03935 [Nitrososphaeria archaeon]